MASPDPVFSTEWKLIRGSTPAILWRKWLGECIFDKPDLGKSIGFGVPYVQTNPHGNASENCFGHVADWIVKAFRLSKCQPLVNFGKCGRKKVDLGQLIESHLAVPKRSAQVLLGFNPRDRLVNWTHLGDQNCAGNGMLCSGNPSKQYMFKKLKRFLPMSKWNYQQASPPHHVTWWCLHTISHPGLTDHMGLPS